MTTTARQRSALGAYGEALAARHLTDKGMVLLDRNWRCELGELDLVLRRTLDTRPASLGARPGREAEPAEGSAGLVTLSAAMERVWGLADRVAVVQDDLQGSGGSRAHEVDSLDRSWPSGVAARQRPATANVPASIGLRVHRARRSCAQMQREQMPRARGCRLPHAIAAPSLLLIPAEP